MKNLFLLGFCFVFSIIYSQDDEITIRMTNYTPEWVHISKDISIVDYRDDLFKYSYNGFNHFHARSYSYTDGDQLYLLYMHYIRNGQTGTLGAFIGGFVEKISLTSGEVKATAYFDLRNNTQRERPVALLAGEDGSLEVINMRHTGALPDLMLEGTLSVYRYDTSNLNLLDHFYADNKDSLVKVFNLPIATKSGAIIHSGLNTDNYDILEKVLIPKNGYNLYGLRLLELDRNGISRTTSEDFQRIPKNQYNWVFDMYPFELNEDTICHPVFYNVRNQDSIYAAFRYYDQQLNYLGEMDIKDRLINSRIPYEVVSVVQNHWIMKASFAPDFIPIFNRSFYHFNASGEVLEYYDISDNHPNPTALKLKDEPGFLIMASTNNADSIEVFKTNGNGTMKYIRSFTFDNEYRLTPIRLTQLHNGDVLMFAHVLIDTLQNTNTSLAKAIVRFKADDLSIPTRVQDLSPLNISRVDVFPNPSDRQLIISFEHLFSGRIEIIDVSGATVLELPVHEVKKREINIQNLIPGPYLLKVRSNKNNQSFEVKHFIKK